MATLNVEKPKVETLKPAPLDLEAIKRKITAIKAAKSGIDHFPLSRRASGPTDEAQKLLMPDFAKAGIDTAKLDAMLRGKPTFDRSDAPLPANVEQTRKDLITAIQNQSTALQKLHPPYAPPSTTEWVQPLWILPEPAGMLTDTSLAVEDNIFKVKVDTKVSGNYGLRLYHFWTNPSEYETVIDMRTFVLFYGRNSAWSAGGFWWGNRHCEMWTYVFMNIYSLWQNTVIQAHFDEMTNIGCDSGGFLASAAASSVAYEKTDFPNELQFPVPGRASVAIEIIPLLFCDVADGEAVFDYSSKGFCIITPGVQVTNYGSPA